VCWWVVTVHAQGAQMGQQIARSHDECALRPESRQLIQEHYPLTASEPQS